MSHYARWIDFLGGSLQQVGSIMGFAAALSLVLRPWMAQFINRIGAKRMWGIGYLVFAGGSLANLWLTGIGPGIYGVRATILFGQAIVFASGLTYIAQVTPEHRRTEAIGILGVGGFLGMLIGPYLGDVFLGGPDRQRVDFAVLFVVAAAASALPVLSLMLLRPSVNQNQPGAARLIHFVRTAKRYWPGTILAVDLVFGMAMTVPFIFLASFIDKLQLALASVSVIGLFFWCYASAAISIRIFFRTLPDRLGPSRVLLVGLLFMAVGMFSYNMVHSGDACWIVVPALLTGIGHGLVFHTMTSLTIKRFPNSFRGTGSALALMALDLGQFVGAPFLGFIGERFGFSTLFCTMGTLLVLVAAAYRHAESKRQ